MEKSPPSRINSSRGKTQDDDRREDETNNTIGKRKVCVSHQESELII